MIIVCEPQCKGISHEKVNAGFLYGLKMAYPREEIKFFADKSHFRELKQRVTLEPIYFNSDISFSLSGILQYVFLIKHIFNRTISWKERRVFFLSTSPVILFVIKILKSFKKYSQINCIFVLHGELEDISSKKYEEQYVSRPVMESISFGDLIKHPGIVFLILKNVILFPLTFLSNKYRLVFKKIFRTKKMMLWKHSDNYRYISLSPHVTRNAGKYIDTKYLNFHTIVMPIIFNRPSKAPNNRNIKFAVFGYGDSAQMQKMLGILSKKRIKMGYEIKIISMDSRGTEGFKNVTRVGNGSVLTREEMEITARDIDVFINLYDKTRHRLGCSLSIFEAFSHLKPVLYLSNDGYDYFNKAKKPIGYKTKSLDGFANKMVDMINNYDKYKPAFIKFRKNMLEYRLEYDIGNNLDKLRESFTYASNK